MNKNPISNEERQQLRAEHRARVARCTEDLQVRYAAQKIVDLARQQAEEEYFNE